MEILAGLLLAVVAGFVPMIFYSTVMWWVDRYEKEPWWLLALVFLWGAIPAVIVAIVAQVVLAYPLGVTLGAEGQPSLGQQLMLVAVIAPFTEEITKGLAILALFLFFRREIDSLLDGVVYGALVGCGFAATENVLYGLGALAQGGLPAFLGLSFLRSIVFGLNHAFFTSLIGVGFALARHGRTPAIRFLSPLAGLVGAMLFHAIHNFGATLASQSLGWLAFSFLFDWLGIAGVGVLVLATLARERRWIETELAEEVEFGHLSAGEAALLASSWARFGALLGGRVRGRPVPRRALYRFLDRATKLAFLKRHLREVQDDPGAPERIERLRAEMAESRRGTSFR